MWKECYGMYKKHSMKNLHARENGWAASTMGWGYILDVSLD